MFIQISQSLSSPFLLIIGHFFFAEYETNETVFDLISSIGGLLGVCAGVSILSCADILYWFALKMITNIV